MSVPRRSITRFERAHVSTRLREKQRRRSTLTAMALDEVSEAVFIVDSDREVVLTNAPAEELGGRSSAALPFTLHDEDGLVEGDCCPVTLALEGRSSRRELTLKGERGGSRPVRLSARPITVEHRRCALLVIRDLTEERERERQRTEFDAMVVHDLRAPLSALLLQAHILSRTQAAGSAAAKFAGDVRRNGMRLERIIGDLLDVARLETGTLSVKPRAMPVAATLETLVADLRPGLGDREIRCRLDPSCPEVLADPARFEQIFTNLLQNAARYSGEGSLIEVDVARRGDQVRISVQDHGVGIGGAELPRLFQRFFRGESSRSCSQGMGLGLSIVQGLVSAHHGTLTVESEQGVGTTCHVLLPAAGKGACLAGREVFA